METLQVQSSNTAPNSQRGKNGGVVSVDWLTMSQEHVGSPLLGKSLMLFIDPATGEVESQAMKSLTHEGSYASKLLVRSDGCRVEVSGNPSRWGMPHSLDGFRDVGECAELYNTVLRALELPEFYEVSRNDIGFRLLQRGDGRTARFGCRITRLDLAELFETGSSSNASTAVRALAQVTHQGKLAMLYGNGETAAWGGGSRHVYFKYYSKGPEMKRHGTPESQPAAEWASSVGLLRHEVTLKAMWLAKSGLDAPSLWNEIAMREAMNQYAMHRRVGISSNGWSHTYEQLLTLGVPETRARRAQDALYAYLAGHRIAPKAKGGNLPNGTYYRLKADLKLVGVDIGAPLNVSALQVSVRVVELRQAYLPEGFRRTG